jgi:hypothetical protein
MSTSIQSLPNPPAPPPRGLSATTLILALALAVFVASTIVLAVLYLRLESPGAAARGDAAPGAVANGAAMQQRDTVSPHSSYTGTVNYPLPYGAPPNLKLSAATREYEIVKQDEAGFTWKALAKLDDFKDDKRHLMEGHLGRDIGFQTNVGALKPNLRFEDFTWEARGMRPGKDTVFVQQGVFNTIADKEGEVNFPIPYGAAPNVELTGQASGAVIIVESRPASFKWKNVPQAGPFAVNSGSVNWKSKGVRAAEIQQKPQ